MGNENQQQGALDPALPASAEAIATALGESDAGARFSIEQLVALRGLPWVIKVWKKTQAVEAAGGMLVFDKTRRRTPGGVFFFLARRKLKDTELPIVFPGWKPPPASQVPERLAWADRMEPARDARAAEGEASNVKITLIGRPGRTVEKNNVVVTAMQNRKAPSLPKGLPSPPVAPSHYTVYIASRQWKRVADAIKNPDDVLIVEGYPALDEATKTIAVFASNVTTRLLQQARREEQKAEAAQGHKSPSPE